MSLFFVYAMKETDDSIATKVNALVGKVTKGFTKEKKAQVKTSPELLTLITQAKSIASSEAITEELKSIKDELEWAKKVRIRNIATNTAKSIITEDKIKAIADNVLLTPPPIVSPIIVPTGPGALSSPSTGPSSTPLSSIVIPPIGSHSPGVSPASITMPLTPTAPLAGNQELNKEELLHPNTRPKVILLNTNEMAFFTYNLFSHDISHDAHPSGLGTKRFNDAILAADEDKVDSMSSEFLFDSTTPDPLIIPGGGVQRGGIGYNLISSKEINDSINSIIGSVSNELINNQMLFALETKRTTKYIDIFKKWEKQTFIIIDLKRIVKKFRKQDSTYPGYIYCNNTVIMPYNITVRKTASSTISVEWTTNFQKFNIRFNTKENTNIIFTQEIEGKEVTTKYVRMSKIREAGTENFNAAIKVLGDKFFYGIFTDYMENKSANKIDGLNSLFPFYVQYKIQDGVIPIVANNFFVNLNIKNYKLYYNYYLSLYKIFVKELSDDEVSNEKKIVIISNLNIPGINNYKNEYINFLAQIFANQIVVGLSAEDFKIKYVEIQNTISRQNTASRQIVDVSKKEFIIFLTISNFYFNQKKTKQVLGDEFKGDVSIDEDDDVINIEPENEETYNTHIGGFSKNKKIQFGGAPLTFMKTLFSDEVELTNPIDFKVFTGDAQNYNPTYLSKVYTPAGALVPREILNFEVNPPIVYDLGTFSSIALPYRQEIFNASKSNSVRMDNFILLLTTELKKKKVEISNIIDSVTNTSFPIEALFLENTDAVERHLSSDPDFINYIKSFKEFEQNIFRQIKIAIYYLKIKKGPPVVVPLNKDDFFKNLLKNLDTYKLVSEVVVYIMFAKPKLSQAQKINGSYMIASAVLSMSHYMKKMAGVNPANSTILTSEINLLSNIFLKKNLLKGSAGTDIDDRLLTDFITWLTPGTAGGAGAFNPKSTFVYNDVDLPSSKTLWKSTKIKKPAGKLHYISNAVNATKVGLPTFICPFSSIVDGQSTCNSYKSALDHGNPVEIGLINVIVRDGKKVDNQSTTTNETMRYHVRVEKHSDPSKWVNNPSGSGPKFIRISAYLKIGTDVIINIGKVGDYVKPESKPKPYIDVDLNSSSSPLEASACIKTIMDICVNTLQNPDGTYKKWDDYLVFLNSNSDTMIVSDPTNPINNITKSSREVRNEILSASFMKSLGDYLQELNIVAENGGYSGSIESDPPNNIALPSVARFGFSNDRPSGVRLVLLLLFGKTDINKNSFGGYITEKGHYLVGIRDKTISIAGGGGAIKNKNIKKNTKRKNYNNKTKKKHNYKYKKITKKQKNKRNQRKTKKI